jgi:hypothetical protein
MKGEERELLEKLSDIHELSLSETVRRYVETGMERDRRAFKIEL